MKKALFHGNVPVIPGNQVILDRPRLERVLEDAMKSAIVTVTAGAGYGKTLGLYSFLQKTDLSVFWFQVSEQDNMAIHFWEKLTGIISRRNEGVGQALFSLGFPATVQQYERMRRILERDVGVDIRYVIVLDDCHLLRPGPVLDLVKRAVTIPPFNQSVILISRVEPEINTVSLLSKEIIARVTADDLRFTGGEIAAYYRLLGVSFPEEEIAAILEDTGGWPMAVGLMGSEFERLYRNPADARGIPGRGVDVWSYARSGLRERSWKHLEEDAYAALSPELRKFLIKLSLVDHWPPELLEELSPGRNLADILERASPFIQYDSYRYAYSMHRILVDYLRERQDEIPPDERREVYTRAARWCLRNGLSTDAAAYCGQGRNYRDLIGITSAFPCLMTEQSARFFLDIIDRLLAGADAAPPESREEAEDILRLRYIERTRFLLSLERIDEIEECCRAAILRFSGQENDPLAARILTACYNNLGIVAYFSAPESKNYDFSAWEDAARNFRPQGGERSDVDPGLKGYICPVGWPAAKGEYERAIAAIQAAIPSTVVTMRGGYYGLDSLAMMEYAWYRGDLAAAETSARQAIYQAREKDRHSIEQRALFFLLRICIANGNLAELHAVIRQFDALLDITEFSNRYSMNNVSLAWFNAHTGRIGNFDNWLDSEYYEERLGARRSFQNLVKAKCFFTVKRYAETLNILDSARMPGAVSGGTASIMPAGSGPSAPAPKEWHEYLFCRLDKTLLRAAALVHLHEKSGGDPAEALHSFEEAWRLAEPNGFEMPFVELGGECCRLVDFARRQQNCVIPQEWLAETRRRASAYAKKLLKITENPGVSGAGQSEAYLSWREKAVLESLSLGWSRERIAKKLNASLNTVKAEIGRLYAKLGALNRADAVRMAIEMNILDAEKNSR